MDQLELCDEMEICSSGNGAGRARSMSMDVLRRGSVDARRRSIVIAANSRARTAPEIDLAGLQFENYRRNPVVMWAHDSTGRSPSGGLPIGRTLNISRAEDGSIVAEFEFLEGDPFAQRIRNAWDKGFLQAASISWLPIESEPAAGGSVRDVRAELLEWSIVSVPSDPDALRESHLRMLNSLLGGQSGAAESSIGVEADWAEIRTLTANLLSTLRGPPSGGFDGSHREG